MLEKGAISVKQFEKLVFTFTVGSSVLYIPSVLAAKAKQDAWIASGFGVIVGLFIVKVMISVAKLYPKLNFVQYTEIILGKWIGTLVNLTFFLNFFMLSSFVLRDVGDFVTILIMPDTPIQAILIMFIFIVILALRSGLETYARTMEILFPWLILMIVLLLVATIPQMKFSNLQPIFESEVRTIIQSSFPFIANPFLQFSVFLMIFPYVLKKKEAEKGFFLGILKGGILLVIFTLCCILVLGVHLTASHLYPTYALAQTINIGGVLQRFEAVLGGIWILSIFFKLTICFYVSTLSLAEILKLNKYRLLTLPLGMILVVLSTIVYPSIASTTEFVKVMFTYFSIMGLFIPVILLGLSKMRRSRASE